MMHRHKASVWIFGLALFLAGATQAADDGELDALYRQGGSCTRTAIAGRPVL